ASNFYKKHNEKNSQNGTLLDVRTSRLLFGGANVGKETKDNSLKGRIINILEKDGNEFSRHLNALIHDENFRNELNFLTHDSNVKRTLNALMRDDTSESLSSISSFEENFKRPLNELKRNVSEDSIFGDLGVYNSDESIDDISNDSLFSSGLDIVKNEKHFTKADAISEQKELDKLIREQNAKRVTESGIYGLLKQIDRKVESEMLNIMKSDFGYGYDNNKKCSTKCKSVYKKFLNDIKQYRIFLPFIITGAIAVVLIPHILFGCILGTTATCSASLFYLYIVSLFSSFSLGIYYQIKYEKCSKIIRRFLKYKKRPSLKRNPMSIYCFYRSLKFYVLI
ncbi:Pv-fam-d protein, partial [Plasmodium cynomolgi strain B]